MPGKESVLHNGTPQPWRAFYYGKGISTMKLILAIALGAAALLGAQAAAADHTSTYGKRLTSTDAVAKSRAGSFDVYIDKPTGFAFVNTPAGWTFTRKVPDDTPALGGRKPGSIAKF
jgi:hypothetical protein